ncbi:DUF4843 domain-containing protein [Pedobacter nutrimenti]|uniref:DUF4843 domain-containing protein n=1 Tax=Pedobacter nutrimenti TaxID=1241337 RepID=UPI00292EF785|nr:DUF4843 domain-containing protein [Pedobacter nutrimenti]
MMKKKLIYVCMLLVIITAACKKEDILTYNDELSKNSIYFPAAETTNNVNISFGYAKINVQDSLLKIVVRSIGSATNMDRPYNLSISDSSTLKVNRDYKLLNEKAVIKAGKVADTLFFKLFRTENIRKDSLFLYLDLKPNENFTNAFLNNDVVSGGRTRKQYVTRLKIKVDDIAGAPPFWVSGSSYGSFTEDYLGAFSTLKFQLLINRFNLNTDEIVKPDWFMTNSNYYRLIGWSNGLKIYLDQMEAKGTPVYEADGVTLMKMGQYAE